MKNSFIVHLDYKDDLQLLSRDERGAIFDAMFSYAETGEVPTFDDRALAMAFAPIKRWMDKDAAAYEETCRKNRANGAKGGAPVGNQNAKKQPKTTQNNRTVEKTTQNNPKQAKQPDNEYEYEYDNDHDLMANNIRYWGSIDYEGSAVVVPLSTGKTYTITPERIAELQKVYREISVPSELNIMAEVMRSSPSKRKTETQIELTINHWLQNARSTAIGQNKIAEAKAPKKKLTPAEEVDTWTITL